MQLFMNVYFLLHERVLAPAEADRK